MITNISLLEDFKRIGIKKGDTVFLRISYKAIGKVEGGPRAFLETIISYVGEEGTILLTAFPTRFANKIKFLHWKDAIAKGAYAEPITGIMSKIALTMPNVHISAREDFPFVSFGKHAQYLTENHTYDKEGYWILEEAINKYNCICLRVGGEPFIGTTHMSLSHILRERGDYQMAPRYGLYVKDRTGFKWIENNNVVFCLNALKKYLPLIKDEITINEGKIGEGYAIITDMKKSMSLEEELFRKDINHILCNNPDCCVCRTSFSFSEESLFHYLFRQIRVIFNGKDTKKKLLKLKTTIKLFVLFRTKNN